MSPQLEIPYMHYVLVYLDQSGKVQYQLSPSMQDQPWILSLNFEKHFLQHIQQATIHNNRQFPQEHMRKRQRVEYSTSDDTSEETDLDEPVDNEQSEPMDKITLPIGDEQKVLAYYVEAFKAFQQINCREIAKACIKVIEPQKQTKHPYTGGSTRDPESTKPCWWPTDVIHKEPDHLKKHDRIRLLIHIFRKSRCSAQKLRYASKEAKQNIKPPEKLDILNEIYRVREAEECYERGEIGWLHLYFYGYILSNALPSLDANSEIFVTEKRKMVLKTIKNTIRHGTEKRDSDTDKYQPGNMPENDPSVRKSPLKQHWTVPNFEDSGAMFPLPNASEGIKTEYEKFTPMVSPTGYLNGIAASSGERSYYQRCASAEYQTVTSFQQPIPSTYSAGMIPPQQFIPHSVPAGSYLPYVPISTPFTKQCRCFCPFVPDNCGTDTRESGSIYECLPVKSPL
ncbi:conserved hypothetical protein [Histoplasma capsulatum var. duboisii H88]|uniref:Subtelomeric hrmA-associated cluster protein AFUB-079030/YDR124W-like helical bundle domain-containing protein n=1 Tax=Ajellomyces capsulatus (strain H88) TaxID=544711 RepID=F0U9Q8_AJEC8|nr:conserved hypothetical protein [Histoplasma capsulatum var. duboisii H88]